MGKKSSNQKLAGGDTQLMQLETATVTTPFYKDPSVSETKREWPEFELKVNKEDWPSSLSACSDGDILKVRQLLPGNGVNFTDNGGVSALIVASINGHIKVVEYLLKHGAMVDMREKSNKLTALMAASQNGHYSVAKLLLAHGAQPNLHTNTGTTALMMACRNGFVDIVELLLNNGTQPDLQESLMEMSALLIAIGMEHYAVVKLLLEKSAKVDIQNVGGKSGLMLASEEGLYEMVKLLLDHGAKIDLKSKGGSSALKLATHHGHYAVTTLLLSRGAQIDSLDTLNQTPLYGACYFGHYKVVELLLNSGAQPNIQTKDGISPLRVASFEGHYRIARLLLQKGALPNQQGIKGLSALHAACLKGHCDIAELLVEHGATIDLQDNNCCSPLMLAIEAQHHEVAILLIEKGAQVNVCDNKGRSPLHLACMVGDYDVTKFLINNGAIVDAKACQTSPLTLSCSRGRYDIARLLLDNGAHPNLRVSLLGTTALMYACEQEEYDLAKLLLDRGALPDMQDYTGNSALLFSIGGENREVSELLLTRGAKPNLRNIGGLFALARATSDGNYELTQLLLRAQVTGADVFFALVFFADAAGSAVVELLIERCLMIIRRNNALVVNSGFPGVVFWDAPIHHCITSQGATIQSSHTGISLSIPEHALSSTEKDMDLLIHPCFSGPFELPDGYESASPAYLIQPKRKVEIQKDITLQIHHYACLRSKKDCEEMRFFSASQTPQYRSSKPVHVFKEITQSQGVFRPYSRIGEIGIRHFCCVKLGRKRSYSKLKNRGENVYSARLYRTSQDCLGTSAVFCMSLGHPIYTEYCDRKISEEYNGLSCKGETKIDRLVQMKGNEVTLKIRNRGGWSITIDKEPMKITKVDVDLPELLNMDPCKLRDYPPKFTIFVHPCSVSSEPPQLIIQGVDVGDCSFEIIPPGTNISSLLPTPCQTLRPKAAAAVMNRTSLDPSLNLHCILNELVTVNSKWEQLGIELNIAYHTLQDIEANYRHSIEKCMAEVIARWLAMDVGEFSWTTLCTALRSKLVDCPVLAAKIEVKYC